MESLLSRECFKSMMASGMTVPSAFFGLAVISLFAKWPKHGLHELTHGQAVIKEFCEESDGL